MTKQEREKFGAEIGYLIARAADIEGEKWVTAVMYNVDIETFKRIKTAKQALDNPIL
jgi:hypothetical protein